MTGTGVWGGFSELVLREINDSNSGLSFNTFVSETVSSITQSVLAFALELADFGFNPPIRYISLLTDYEKKGFKLLS